MIFKQNQNYWAVFYANKEALIVQTCSGLGLTAIDHLYLPPYPAGYSFSSYEGFAIDHLYLPPYPAIGYRQ